jgi:hypothetical protein
MRELKKNRSSVSRDNARATILSYGADMIKLEEFIRGISHGSQAKIHKFKIYVTNCNFNSNNSERVGNSNGGHDLFEPMFIPNLTLSLIIKLQGLTLPLNGLFRESSAPKRSSRFQRVF